MNIRFLVVIVVIGLLSTMFITQVKGAAHNVQGHEIRRTQKWKKNNIHKTILLMSSSTEKHTTSNQKKNVTHVPMSTRKRILLQNVMPWTTILHETNSRQHHTTRKRSRLRNLLLRKYLFNFLNTTEDSRFLYNYSTTQSTHPYKTTKKFKMTTQMISNNTTNLMSVQTKSRKLYSRFSDLPGSCVTAIELSTIANKLKTYFSQAKESIKMGLQKCSTTQLTRIKQTHKSDFENMIDIDSSTMSFFEKIWKPIKKSKGVYVTQYFMPVLVAADKSFIEFHKEIDYETYILTALNMVSNYFFDMSLGMQISVPVVRIIYLDKESEQFDDLMAYAVLKKFCHWANKIKPLDKKHPQYYDVAILITRRELLSCKCSNMTMGATYIASACLPCKACAVVQDTGLLLGVNIAHQLGHLVGAIHDDGINGACPSEAYDRPHVHLMYHHIMSPHLELERLVWSECSRVAINKFFMDGLGSCLEDRPPRSIHHYSNMLPGSMYHADKQCDLLFRGTKACILNTVDFCKQLLCTYGNGTCFSNGVHPAQGTPCGLNKWCFNTECVHLGYRPAAINGRWSDWCEWGPCSRTCGGGVMISRRYCNNPPAAFDGHRCLGSSHREKICNSHPCDPRLPSFRASQCAYFNRVPISGSFHKWRPVLRTIRSDRCALYCVDEHNVTARLRPRATDGTPCRKGTKYMCIDGVCTRVGCDWRLRSTAMFDRCGVCGGDGGSCRHVRAWYNQSHTNDHDKYVFVANIPERSRNIKIYEARPSDNRLAIAAQPQNSSLKYLAGGPANPCCGQFLIGRKVGYLTQLEPCQDYILIRGPLPFEIKLYVVKNTSIVPIHYSYMSFDREPQIPYQLRLQRAEPENFMWEYLDWTKCTAICKGGTMRAKPRCVSIWFGLVDSYYCRNILRPPDQLRVCNVRNCAVRWRVGPWGECCPGMLQFRKVYCMKEPRLYYESEVIVEHTLCVGKRPASTRKCQPDCCNENQIFDVQRVEQTTNYCFSPEEPFNRDDHIQQSIQTTPSHSLKDFCDKFPKEIFSDRHNLSQIHKTPTNFRQYNSTILKNDKMSKFKPSVVKAKCFTKATTKTTTLMQTTKRTTATTKITTVSIKKNETTPWSNPLKDKVDRETTTIKSTNKPKCKQTTHTIKPTKEAESLYLYFPYTSSIDEYEVETKKSKDNTLRKYKMLQIKDKIKTIKNLIKSERNTLENETRKQRKIKRQLQDHQKTTAMTKIRNEAHNDSSSKIKMLEKSISIQKYNLFNLKFDDKFVFIIEPEVSDATEDVYVIIKMGYKKAMCEYFKNIPKVRLWFESNIYNIINKSNNSKDANMTFQNILRNIKKSKTVKNKKYIRTGDEVINHKQRNVEIISHWTDFPKSNIESIPMMLIHKEHGTTYSVQSSTMRQEMSNINKYTSLRKKDTILTPILTSHYDSPTQISNLDYDRTAKPYTNLKQGNEGKQQETKQKIILKSQRHNNVNYPKRVFEKIKRVFVKDKNTTHVIKNANDRIKSLSNQNKTVTPKSHKTPTPIFEHFIYDSYLVDKNIFFMEEKGKKQNISTYIFVRFANNKKIFTTLSTEKLFIFDNNVFEIHRNTTKRTVDDILKDFIKSPVKKHDNSIKLDEIILKSDDKKNEVRIELGNEGEPLKLKCYLNKQSDDSKPLEIHIYFNTLSNATGDLKLMNFSKRIKKSLHSHPNPHRIPYHGGRHRLFANRLPGKTILETANDINFARELENHDHCVNKSACCCRFCYTEDCKTVKHDKANVTVKICCPNNLPSCLSETVFRELGDILPFIYKSSLDSEHNVTDSTNKSENKIIC